MVGAKFDETVDAAVRLGVNPAHADQMVRGSVVLPNGLGKTVRVLVFAKGDKEKEALEAGADLVGNDEIIEKIKGGWLEFDRVIATPDMMGSVGKIAKILGPRGLMPNPKVGTVTMDGWKNYSIPLSSDISNTAALVPADPTNILFFGLIAYSKAYRGAIYVDWIVFKTKNGTTSDTVYNFNQTGPQEGNNNVVSVDLYPTANVASDLTWQTATTSVWGATGIRTRKSQEHAAR